MDGWLSIPEEGICHTTAFMALGSIKCLTKKGQEAPCISMMDPVHADYWVDKGGTEYKPCFIYTLCIAYHIVAVQHRHGKLNGEDDGQLIKLQLCNVLDIYSKTL